MTRALVLLALLVPPAIVHADSAPTSPPPLDRVLAEATHANKPVLLEFFAVWCEPCKELSAELDAPAAQPTRQRFVVQSYDIERGAGRLAAARYGLGMEVPVLLVLDADGHELARHTGYDSGKVLAWLDRVAQRRNTTDRALESELALAPNDADILMMLLRRAQVRGAHADVLGWLAKQEASDTTPERWRAARAAWERIQLTVAWRIDEEIRPLLIDYMTKYPRHSEHALSPLVALRAPASVIHQQVESMRNALDDEFELYSLAMTLRTLRLFAEAVPTAEKLVEKSPTNAAYRKLLDEARQHAADLSDQAPGPGSVRALLGAYAWEALSPAETTNLFFAQEAEKLPTACRRQAPSGLESFVVRIIIGEARHPVQVEVLEPRASASFRRCATGFFRRIEIPVDTPTGTAIVPVATAAPTAY